VDLGNGEKGDRVRVTTARSLGAGEGACAGAAAAWDAG